LISFKKSANKRARIQGFADHSEADQSFDNKSSTSEIFKNIQPISVGV
jgi:hypothetical protein